MEGKTYMAKELSQQTIDTLVKNYLAYNEIKAKYEYLNRRLQAGMAAEMERIGEALQKSEQKIAAHFKKEVPQDSRDVETIIEGLPTKRVDTAEVNNGSVPVQETAQA